MTMQKIAVCVLCVVLVSALASCDQQKKSPWTNPSAAHDVVAAYGEPEDTNLYLAQTFRRILDLSTSQLPGPLGLRLDALYAPDAARVWLTKHFGDVLGAQLSDDLSAEWPGVRAQLQKDLEYLRSPIEPTVYAERAVKSGNRTASLTRNLAFKRMKESAPLSGVVMQRGTLDFAVPFEHLVFLEGEFRYIGSLRRLEQRAGVVLPLPFAVFPGAQVQAQPPTDARWSIVLTPAGVEVRQAQQTELYNVLPLPTDGETITKLAVVGHLIAGGTNKGRLILWNPDTGREVASIPPPKQDTVEGVRDLHVNGATVLAIGTAGHLWLWDTDLGRPLTLFAENTAAAWLSSTGIVIAIENSGGAFVWDFSALF